MASYNQRLQRELERRNHALTNMARCGSNSAAIVTDKITQTQMAIRAEFEHFNAGIRGQIQATGNVVRRNIDQTGETVSRQIDGLKTSLNPAKIIHEHPWGAALAAALAGAVVVPLLKSQFNHPRNERVVAKSFLNGTAAESEAPRGSRWTPVVDVLLESLPALIVAFTKRDNTPA